MKRSTFELGRDTFMVNVIGRPSVLSTIRETKFAISTLARQQVSPAGLTPPPTPKTVYKIRHGLDFVNPGD